MKIMRIISKEKDKIMKQIEFCGKYNGKIMQNV